MTDHGADATMPAKLRQEPSDVTECDRVGSSPYPTSPPERARVQMTLETLATESDRWWQAFCAEAASGRRHVESDARDEVREGPDVLARACADFADAALEEARKRGRA